MSDPKAIISPRRATAWVWLALALVIAAPVVYFPLMDDATVRRTAWPTWSLLVAGAALGLWAARRDARRFPKVLAGLELAFVAFALVAFLGFARLPAASAPQPLARDFSLPDPGEQAVSLYEKLERGPVLLVFYRGFW